MPVTREPDFPAEAAALVDAFSRCSDGYDVDHVVQAASNFLTMALHGRAKARGDNLSRAEAVGRAICKSLVADLAAQWNRTPKPTDVGVNQN